MKSAFLVLATALGHSLAWMPPDTVELKAEFKVTARDQGKPRQWVKAPKSRGEDSLRLTLTWREGLIAEARYEQANPFDQESFSDLAEAYGGGGTWHALPDAAPQGPETKLYPGLMQQWLLQGFDGDQGWSGSGEIAGRFFLIFRREPLTPPAMGDGPIALRPEGRACQDTLSHWLQIPCPKDWEKLPSGAKCFSPEDNPRRLLALLPTPPAQKSLTWWAWWQEGDPLQEVAEAMAHAAPGSENAYGQDLSRILFGEAQIFLAQVAQASPCVFKQPSWAFTKLNTGFIPPEDFQRFIGKKAKRPDWLPALKLGHPTCSLSVDIAMGGAYRLRARSLP